LEEESESLVRDPGVFPGFGGRLGGDDMVEEDVGDQYRATYIRLCPELKTSLMLYNPAGV
jgi:hypothetical protein